MSQLYLSRITLRQDQAISALMPLFTPSDSGARQGVGHRLIWSVFADREDRTRDFLWRQTQTKQWLTLSAREPHDPLNLFDIETKTFEPDLAAGDRLGFSLRANAVIARKQEDGKRSRCHDIVMDRLHQLPTSERAAKAYQVTQEAALDWLTKQGVKAGFTPTSVVANYRKEDIPHDGSPIRLGLLDMDGGLTIDDPERFNQAIQHGFGKAKGFGCGLMLIRRMH